VVTSAARATGSSAEPEAPQPVLPSASATAAAIPGRGHLVR